MCLGRIPCSQNARKFEPASVQAACDLNSLPTFYKYIVYRCIHHVPSDLQIRAFLGSIAFISACLYDFLL